MLLKYNNSRNQMLLNFLFKYTTPLPLFYPHVASLHTPTTIITTELNWPPIEATNSQIGKWRHLIFTPSEFPALRSRDWRFGGDFYLGLFPYSVMMQDAKTWNCQMNWKQLCIGLFNKIRAMQTSTGRHSQVWGILANSRNLLTCSFILNSYISVIEYYVYLVLI